MKLLILNMFVFLAAASGHADTADQPGAYEKINAMYESAAAPASLDALYALLPKLKDCAGSYTFNPNRIEKAPLLTRVVYHKPTFGPDFPAEDHVGLALNISETKVTSVDNSFFNFYSAQLRSNEVVVHTTKWEDDLDCDTIASGCLNLRKSNSIDVTVRVSDKYVLFKSTESLYDSDDDTTWDKEMIAYCWQK
jgi:hypothetical protein